MNRDFRYGLPAVSPNKSTPCVPLWFKIIVFRARSQHRGKRNFFHELGGSKLRLKEFEVVEVVKTLLAWPKGS